MHFLNQENNFTCPTYISSYILDLTSSYTNKSNESAIVSASVIMFGLVGLFFNLNLFSGISDVSATLDPKVRLFLSSMLSLFLPVMSYLFSEAKNASGYSTPFSMTDLSLRAGLILAWMLLVELLRKKVDAIHMQSYSGIIQRAARVIWLGNLVFFNISNIGRKAFFSILWILCATKLVQRVAFTEVGKRSYVHGKNARLISSYMAQMMQHDNHIESHCFGAHVGEQAVNGENELLRRCKYIVVGEEKLVEKPTANGYKLKKITPDSNIVTVGKVWALAEEDNVFTALDKDQHLKRLCLSFALFKLLRRRFERVPALTDREAHNCRALLLKGIYNNGERAAEALFKVMNDEVTFLSEYYHSVIPVALASPFFLLVNYFLLHIVIIMLCLMTFVICGNGDVSEVFNSIDIGTLQSSFSDIVICLISRASYSPAAFFSIVDLFITVFLFIIFFYEEIWEFLVFLLSNWFLVSLLCNHMANNPHERMSRTFSWAIRIIMWLRSKMIPTNISFKQFSILSLHWPPNLPLLAIPSLVVKTELVPDNLKRSVIEYLAEHDRGTTGHIPLTNGVSALRRYNLLDQFSWVCNRDSVVEVILMWHIATAIMEVKCTPQNKEEAATSRMAIRLSKYCAYLVVFHPELLPDDNQENAELVLQNMKKELKDILGCRGYYLSSMRTRVEKLIETLRTEETNEAGFQREIQVENRSHGDEKNVLLNGAKLSMSLMAEPSNSQESVWKVLADVWTELIIFVAPSNNEERLRGHENVLAQGGEFISVLWALTTHLGITHLANMPITGGHTEN